MDSTSQLPSAGAGAPRRQKTASMLTSLAIVLALVGGAWYVGEREGFAGIGGGGTNLRLLPRIGDPAPDFSLLNVTDLRREQLSSYRGRPVWINFWGSWCPPCRAEFPDMQAAYAEELAPNGVVVLAIALDEPAEASLGYALRNGGTFTIVSDPNRQDSGAAYPIANFPTHILVDRDGIVRDIILAPIDKEEIVRTAQQIIAPEGTP